MISNTTVQKTYEGNGVTNMWPIPFSYESASQIRVLITTNSIETAIPSSDYTVNESSKSILYPKSGSPITADTMITIYRDTAITQEIDLTNQGGAWPETIEAGLDKLTEIAQELNEIVSRCLKVKISSGDDPEAITSNLSTMVRETVEIAASTKVALQEVEEAVEIATKAAEEAKKLVGGDYMKEVAERLKTHAEDAVLDHPDGSVTTDKLANMAVTTEKLVDASITTEKLDQKSVTCEKLGDGVFELFDDAIDAHNIDKNSHRSIVNALENLMGTGDISSPNSLNIVQIISMLGQTRIVANYFSSTANFVKFSNGLVLQWGKVDPGIGSGVEVTLPIPFSGKDFYCSASSALSTIVQTYAYARDINKIFLKSNAGNTSLSLSVYFCIGI